MTTRRHPTRTTDLRGAVRLATDATTGVTDLVEAMHERIARLPGWPARGAAGRTGGITGFVYKTVRGVTRLAGGSVDTLLGLLAPPADTGALAPARSAEREALVAALNGVLGDHLVDSDNPLATTMALRQRGAALTLQREALAARLPAANGRVLVLLHGLCMNDLQWCRDGHDHGALLAQRAGYTPLYLHYNSGLHVSTNGRALARMLDAVFAQWPQPIERVALLAHSMGGLVARSALEQGRAAGQHWLQRVDDLVFLGTPHHGAPLERAGHWVNLLLGAAPYAAPFARLGRLRSAGITDLRHGNLLDDDWTGNDRFAHGADHRRPVSLPESVRCFAVAAQLGADDGDLKGRLLGDGLVPLDSALGRHADAARALQFEAGRTWVAQGVGHLDLLSDPGVAARLQDWLG